MKKLWLECPEWYDLEVKEDVLRALYIVVASIDVEKDEEVYRRHIIDMLNIWTKQVRA